jgi:hypothetical protein
MSTTATEFTMESILSVLRDASEEQLTEFRKIVGPIRASTPSAPGVKRAPGRPKKSASEAPPRSLPEGDMESAPDASAYRIPADEVDHSVCIGRRFDETDKSKDKRWSPAVYREFQCGGTLGADSDLCETCNRRQEKYAMNPKAGPWLGRVTEDPMEWSHMLGTEWAEKKQPKWMGVPTSSRSSVVSEEDDSASVGAPVEKADKAAEKAEKEAKKAAEKAEKEAKKAAEKAEKEAKKAAEKAEKEAEKEAKKATKPAKKSAAAAESAVAAAVAEPVTPAKADTAAPPVEIEGSLKLIDGTLYMVKGRNVYEYDEITESTSDFVGLLREDETIDTDADEEETD